MLPGKKYGIDDIVRILWARKWVIAIPLIVVSIGVVVFARTLPDVYRSQTTILIVPQRVPESYVRSTVTSRIEDRLPSLRQQILGRDRLEKTILDFGLYSKERATQPLEKIVGLMRAAIKVDIVRGDAFSVSFDSTEPRSAMLVAERLAAQFIEENVREREVLADGTSEFLETQLVQARARLEDHERKLAEYRTQFSGELPSQLDGNLQILNSLNLQAQGISNDLERDRDRALVLDRSLAEAGELPIAGGSGGDTAAMAAPADAPPDKLAASQAALEELRTRLTPEHPDVIAAQRVVADLQRKAAAELQAAQTRAALAGPAAPVPPAPPSAASVARQKRIHDVRLEKDSLDRQIKRKQQELARIQGLVANYQARVESTPARESEMIALTRDYETLRGIYTSLLAKKEDSAVAANLEKRQVSEQFKVLDPARIPQEPFSPNRLQLNALGVFAGLALGLGIVALLELKDATIKTEDDVRTALALPVLAAIPVISEGREAFAAQKSAALGPFRFARRLLRGEGQ